MRIEFVVLYGVYVGLFLGFVGKLTPYFYEPSYYRVVNMRDWTDSTIYQALLVAS